MKCVTIFVLIFIVIVYAIVGAVVLHFLEKDTEQRRQQDVNSQIADFLANNSCVTTQDIVTFNLLLDEMFIGGLDFDRSGNLINTTRWDLATSVFVSIELLATVGYSKAAPKTLGGRIFTVFFSLIGIPPFILTIVGFGKLLNLIAEKLVRRLSGLCSKDDDGVDFDGLHLPPPPRSIRQRLGRRRAVYRALGIGLVGAGLFIFIPSALFIQVEQWTYWEAVYYCGITLITIGFGDLTPGYGPQPEWLSPGWYRLAVGCWIVIVIGWFAGVLRAIRKTIYEFALKTESKIVEATAEVFTIPKRRRGLTIQIAETGNVTSVVHFLPTDGRHKPVKRLGGKQKRERRHSFVTRMRSSHVSSAPNHNVNSSFGDDSGFITVKPRLSNRAELGYEPNMPQYSSNIKVSKT